MEIVPAELNAFPQAWVSVLKKRDTTRLPPGWRAEAVGKLSDGTRHDTFLRLSSSLFNAKWSSADVLAVLRPFAVEQNFNEELDELIEDMTERCYSPEGRLLTMQENTRKAVSAMPIFTADQTAHLQKTFPDLIASAFKTQDAYDREAVRWLTLSILWEGSDAERALSEWGMCVCNLSTSL